MYGAVNDGDKPRLSEALKAFKFRGLLPLLFGLAGRYFGWAFLIGIAVFLAKAIVVVLWRRSGLPPPPFFVLNGVFNIPTRVGTVVVLVLMVIPLSRYVFAVPMLGILKGTNVNLIEASVRRSAGVWRTMSVILFCEYAPTLTVSFTQTKLLAQLAISHWVLWSIPKLTSVLLGCWATWIVMVNTALTLQVLAQMPIYPMPSGSDASAPR